MSFNLINTGATYQRTVRNVLHDMMDKEKELYGDDMINRSKSWEGYVHALKKFFKRL